VPHARQNLHNGHISCGHNGLHSLVGETESKAFLKEVINEVQSANNKHEGTKEEKATQQCLGLQKPLEFPTVSATSIAHQLKDLMSAMKVNNENVQHEMNKCIHERSGFT